jgi:DNA-directed RNA polymerase specialized sigma24 family protein
MANLTAETFEILLTRLDPDRDRAAKVYELLRRKLMMFFERNQCVGTEALADETIDRVARRLEAEEVQDIQLYCLGVARKIQMESRRKAARVVSIGEYTLGDEFLPGDVDLEQRIIEGLAQAKGLLCLEKCLTNLPPSHHHLIVEYYKGEKQIRIHRRQDLAKASGVSIEALRNEAHGIRHKLRGCVNRCLRKSSKSSNLAERPDGSSRSQDKPAT